MTSINEDLTCSDGDATTPPHHVIDIENESAVDNQFQDLIYNYKGMKIKGTRNEAGWNSVYVAGKIIKKIGPILAIKSEDFNQKYVAEKIN